MSKPAKIGPWGGNGGPAQDVNINHKLIRLVSVTINSGEHVINAISFEYVGSDCHMYSTGPWGGIGVKEEKTTIEPLNFVMEIAGTVGKFLNANVVTSLTIAFQTESPKTYGKACGTPFRIPVLDGGRIVGFFGRSGPYLNAIGLYIEPVLEWLVGALFSAGLFFGHLSTGGRSMYCTCCCTGSTSLLE